MDVKVFPSKLKGDVSAPPSKSAAHRALICAGLCADPKVVSQIGPIDDSEDMHATRSGLECLGRSVEEDILDSGRKKISICVDDRKKARVVDCGESGSTYRFFLPILAALGENVEFIGRGKLPERPMEPMFSLLNEKGIECVYPEGKSLPLRISGRLKGGSYQIRGDLSSQYVTGLLFALPLLTQDSEISLTTKLESAPYVNMTLDLLQRSGIQIERTDTGFRIPGGQKYSGGNYVVEGDYSNAAFHLCAGAVSGEGVTVCGLSQQSAQGDQKIVELLTAFGASVETIQSDEDSGLVAVKVKKSRMKGIEIDAQDIPDLVPILAVTAAYAEGKTTIFNAERLRLKESDRLSAISDGLKSLGAEIDEFQDRLVIHGGKALRGGCEVSAANDHRIAMALSTAAIGCEQEVIVRGAQCVRKSYPCYYEDFKKLGGNIDVINLGK